MRVEAVHDPTSVQPAGERRWAGLTLVGDTGLDYRDLLERIPCVSYVAAFGDVAPWYYISPQIETMLGFTPEEWLADATLWYQRIHPEDRAIALEDEATAKMDGKPLMSEYRLVRRDGQVVWVHDEATLIFDADGHPSH